MKTKTLTEAVSQITGKIVTDNEAMVFARDRYMELCFFHRYEVNMIAEKANQLKARKAKREQFKKMYN